MRLRRIPSPVGSALARSAFAQSRTPAHLSCAGDARRGAPRAPCSTSSTIFRSGSTCARGARAWATWVDDRGLCRGVFSAAAPPDVRSGSTTAPACSCRRPESVVAGVERVLARRLAASHLQHDDARGIRPGARRTGSVRSASSCSIISRTSSRISSRAALVLVAFAGVREGRCPRRLGCHRRRARGCSRCGCTSRGLRVGYWAFMPLQAFTRGGMATMPDPGFAIVTVVRRCSSGLAPPAVQGCRSRRRVRFAPRWPRGRCRRSGLAAAMARGRRVAEALLQRGQPLPAIAAQWYPAQGEFIEYVRRQPHDDGRTPRAGAHVSFDRQHALADEHYRAACHVLARGPASIGSRRSIVEAEKRQLRCSCSRRCASCNWRRRSSAACSPKRRCRRTCASPIIMRSTSAAPLALFRAARLAAKHPAATAGATAAVATTPACAPKHYPLPPPRMPLLGTAHGRSRLRRACCLPGLQRLRQLACPAGVGVEPQPRVQQAPTARRASARRARRRCTAIAALRESMRTGTAPAIAAVRERGHGARMAVDGVTDDRQRRDVVGGAVSRPPSVATSRPHAACGALPGRRAHEHTRSMSLRRASHDEQGADAGVAERCEQPAAASARRQSARRQRARRPRRTRCRARRRFRCVPWLRITVPGSWVNDERTCIGTPKRRADLHRARVQDPGAASRQLQHLVVRRGARSCGAAARRVDRRCKRRPRRCRSRSVRRRAPPRAPPRWCPSRRVRAS